MNLSPSQEWKQAKLGQVAKIERKSVQPTDILTGTTYVGLEHIDGEGMFKGVHAVDAGEIASNKFTFDSRHLLYGKLRPYLKKIARPNFSGVCSTDILPILPGTHLDKNFLHYYLRQPKYIELATKRSTGANLPRLSPKTLEEFPVFLPPLEEQKRIAAILDKADAIRQKRKKEIALTEELLRSTFLDMFGDPVTNPKGWNKVKLDAIVTNIDSGWSPKCDSREANSDEWGMLKLGAVTWGNFKSSENKALLPETKPRPELEVKVGDLLFSRKNTYELVGATAYVHSTRPKLLLPDLIFRFCLAETVDPVYLWQTLSRKTMRKELSRLASGSSGSMPNISKARLKNLLVPLPPIDLQLKYKEVVTKFWSYEDSQQQTTLHTDNLFNSLLQKAFRGEL